MGPESLKQCSNVRGEIDRFGVLGSLLTCFRRVQRLEGIPAEHTKAIFLCLEFMS